MRASALLLLALAITATAQVHITTPGTSLLLRADKGTKPVVLHYGARLSDADVRALTGKVAPEAFPVVGMNSAEYGAFAATHADGSLATDVRVDRVEQTGDTTRIILRDTTYPFDIALCYLPRTGTDVIESWTEVRHSEPGAVTLTQFPSAYLPVRRGDVWLSHLSGAWGNEGQLNQEPLGYGIKSIRNYDGVRNSQNSHAEVMLSLDGKPDERTGRTIAAALCYSGNYDISVNTDAWAYHHLTLGIDPLHSAIVLSPDSVFVTPAVAWTYSTDGTSGASRNLHRWGRKNRLMHGDEPRPVLLNSWEGIYFKVNEATVKQMIADVAELGGELFVLDDGWFGDEFHRDGDKQGLGDWVTDPRKLPKGLEPLLKQARKSGIKFGIWIEPEMVNTGSRTYLDHPDWVIGAPKRDHVYGRGGAQLVLDMGNPAVQDFVFGVVDSLLTKYPEIAYIKWDANMHMKELGSQYHPAEAQNRTYTAYHDGFRAVCERIRAKYPDVIMQACASGGGRANWGILPYFDEFWVSDNTDPLERIYMQWGTSYFFPAMTMAQHISASPCHATHRITPIKFRTDVAMSGRLGIELQPSQMSAEDYAFVKNAVETYKKIRPVVQLGDQYRLHSPYLRDGVAALMYVDEPRDNAVFFWYMYENFRNHHSPVVPMDGLDPDKMYRVTELNRIDTDPLEVEGKVFSGAYLMSNGLDLPYNNSHNIPAASPYSSRVLALEAVKD